MYRVLFCLTGQHDYRLVAIAAAICVLSSFMAFWLFTGVRQSSVARRQALLVVTGLCTSAGIWATHFIAMLAYDAGVPVSYDVPLTVASLLIAFAGTTLGFALMASGRMPGALCGGTVIGLGIAAMHFTGMGAVVAAARLAWDPWFVGASVAAGALFGAAAGAAFVKLDDRKAPHIATLLLILAICSMHFTAMAAVSVTADPTMAASTLQFDKVSMALFVVAVTTVLLLSGLVVALVDRFTISRSLIGIGCSILAMLTVTIGINLYAMEHARIGSANYQKIDASKDLVADILPPPLFIVESYVEALEALEALDRPEKLGAHRSRLKELRDAYLERRTHWKGSRLIPEGIREQLVEESHGHVESFWQTLDGRYLPALARGDRAEAQGTLASLTASFRAHRAVIERIIPATNASAQQVKDATGAEADLLQYLAVVTAALLVIVLVGSMRAMNVLVVRPMLTTAGYLGTLASGRFATSVPFADRTDEIGVMAKAIDQLRLASIEKERLEQDAAENRRIADEARRQRDRERAAEELRLRMANESIMGLNETLKCAYADLEKAQDENVRKGKLAQLGQLTATVAHEIRNPLGAIKTAVYLIDRKTKDKNLGLDSQMQRVNNGIQRCDKIITELLDFTRTKALAATAQPLDAWLAAVVEEERRSLPREVAIDLVLGTGDDPMLFDTSRLRRVVVNLLSNAAEAMVGKGGEHAAVATRDPRITVSTSLDGGNVSIVVADNGPGISPENIAKIREPLFTTKSFGVGLGIPAVENILEQHGGGLAIESEVGSGAKMTAWFPRQVASQPASEPEIRKVA